MKPLRNRLWTVLTGALFISFTIVLAFAPTTSVESKSPPTGVENPGPSQTETTTLTGSEDTVEVAQIFGATRYQKLAEADRFYEQGNLEMARTIQREVKPDFAEATPPPNPIVDAENLEELEPGAAVYWRIANEGIEQGLESKIFEPLELLTENYPDFIPGHFLLVDALLKDDRPEEAIEVLERATSLYPDQTELLDRKITLMGEEKRYLEASIAARQFALTYSEHPEAAKYKRLAEENQEKFQSYIKDKLISLGFASVLTSAITGNSSSASIIGLLIQGEVKTGEVLAEQKKKQVTLVEDPKLLEYVNGVGQKLAKLMGRDEFNYEFYVIENSSPNAFALPGGKIFINSGMMKLMGSEAELAGLLGHEIAHSVLSHRFQKMATEATLDSVGQMVPFGSILNAAVTSENSRNLERQSDILGTQAIATAGYAADGLHSVMGIFKQLGGGGGWLSSHPAPATRVRYLEGLIENNGYDRYAYEGVGPYQTALGLVPESEPVTSSDPDSGFALVPSTAQPSQTPPKQIVGPVSLSIVQRKRKVEIRLEGANVEPDGSFTLKVVIKNGSDDEVKIMPLRVEVFDANNREVLSRFSYDEDTGEDIIPLNSTRTGTLSVSGVRWNNSDSQDLTLVIKETLGRTRIFRIPF
ncbi:MAG: M48 family metalloprotease [Xenococcaceae cyanobacterium]